MTNEMKLLEMALSHYADCEMNAIEQAISKIKEPSEELRTRLRIKVHSTTIGTDKKHIPFKKAIAILIAAALLLASLSVVVYAAADKLKIGGFLIEWFDDHLNLKPDVDTDLNKTASIDKVQISYIPDEFILTEHRIFNDRESYEWKKDTCTIYVSLSLFSHTNTSLDRDGNFSIVHVGDYDVYRNIYPTTISAVWTDESITYALSCAGVEWEEMVKIIEGISYKEE